MRVCHSGTSDFACSVYVDTHQIMLSNVLCLIIFEVSERMDNPVCQKAPLAQGESESEALQKHMAHCCVVVASLLNTCVAGKHSVIV